MCNQKFYFQLKFQFHCIFNFSQNVKIPAYQIFSTLTIANITTTATETVEVAEFRYSSAEELHRPVRYGRTDNKDKEYHAARPYNDPNSSMTCTECSISSTCPVTELKILNFFEKKKYY